MSLVAILDADKEGFLRSETSLIQTIGRAARNAEGRVVMYADDVTGSMNRAITETNRRREIQKAYNEKHGITPQSIKKNIREVISPMGEVPDETIADIKISKSMDIHMQIEILTEQMKLAATELRFEDAASIRDRIKTLQKKSQK